MIVLLVLVCIYFLVNLQLFYMRSILFFLSFFSLTCISYAKVVLPAYFTDNMVLQQNTKVTFHGKAALGKTLKVTTDRKSTRLNSSHSGQSRMPSSA